MTLPSLLYVYGDQLWKEYLPYTRMIYRDANELLRSIEHFAKFGYGRVELIVLYPINTCWNAFDQISGIVITVDAIEIWFNI